MKWNIEELKSEVVALLKDSGFPPELYMIKTGNDHVAVFFDTKEAVDYFRVDFDSSEVSKDCIYEYRKEGKRHGAYIYTW